MPRPGWRTRRRGRLSLAGLAGAITLLCLPQATQAATSAVHGTIGPLSYEVLLPPSYGTSLRRYPVVYLITGNGGNEGSAVKYLGLAAYAARDQAIIVTPAERRHNNLITDWADGSYPLDRDFVGQLIPTIDARFRTVADRAHRAIAGVSAGGYSSMAIAARHPDLFVSAAAFSGGVDLTDRGPAGEATVEVAQDFLVDMAPSELFRRFGNPYTHPLSWRERNPADLATNLAGMNLYAGAGNGVPGDMHDIADGGPFIWQTMVVENQISSMTARFVAILRADHIPIAYRPHSGTHDARYWIQDLAVWWPQMLGSLGSPSPVAFAYRDADPAFSVWGWSFRADPRRAAEFLDITDASSSGLSLTGSGTVHVTTAPLFHPGERIRLSGALTPAAISDNRGRLAFDVNLGPPHRTEEYTTLNLAKPSSTRTIRFSAT
jgi:S-formylglutathione hydrolase FrmB